MAGPQLPLLIPGVAKGRSPAYPASMYEIKSKRILVILTLIGTLALAGCSGGPDDSDPVHVSVSVVPNEAEPGGSVTLLWTFEIAPDWHLYWIGRNDSGYPPKVDLDLPDGWLAGGLQWPVPERYVMPGDILDHVYHHDLVLLQKIGVPAEARPGDEVAITAKVGWLGCKDSCVPGSADLSFTVPVALRADAARDDDLVEALDHLPESLPAGLLTTRWEGAVFHISAAGADRLTFMPTEDCGDLVDLIHDGEGAPLALEFRPRRGTAGPVRGLITLESPSGDSHTYIVDFPASVLTDVSPGG
jgi:DsbC/DsbD-like thiol-disulfide interchange protein